MKQMYVCYPICFDKRINVYRVGVNIRNFIPYWYYWRNVHHFKLNLARVRNHHMFKNCWKSWDFPHRLIDAWFGYFEGVSCSRNLFILQK